MDANKLTPKAAANLTDLNAYRKWLLDATAAEIGEATIETQIPFREKVGHVLLQVRLHEEQMASEAKTQELLTVVQQRLDKLIALASVPQRGKGQ